MTEGIKNNGSKDNIILLSRKAQAQMFSSIPAADLVPLESLDQVRRTEDGDAYISPEVLHGALLTFPGSSTAGERTASVRGVKPAAFLVHEQVKLTEGAGPDVGNQIVVGSLAHVRVGVPKEMFAVGKTIRFAGTNWQVTGIFSAPGSMMESEIWTDVNELREAIRRKTYSCISIKLNGEADIPAALASLKKRTDVLTNPFSEVEFYAGYAETFNRMVSLSYLAAIVLSLGGLFIGLNTMYAAMRARIREFATLRILGFSRKDILLAVIMESALIAVPAGVLAALLTFLVNGLPMRMSQKAFIVVTDANIVAVIVGIAVAIGIFGGILPAIRSLRMTVVDGLRHV
jgi:ABC-type lipoprotein release transport system permease subunit